MPLVCHGERRSPSQLEEEEEDEDLDSAPQGFWQHIPDSILLHIFSFLDIQSLCIASAVCKTWYRVALDETLWKSLFLLHNKLLSCELAPGKHCWRSEVKRIYDNSPVLLTEILTEHSDEVLHVSFSHNGQMFSTTSKDATLKIWTTGYPTTLKYSKDFRGLLGWDFTQYSCFNQSDTMVLVSSVKSTDIMDRRGYMAILSVVNYFRILRVVTMDPSQLFGAWLDDSTFLGGSLEISLDRFATTVQIEAHEVDACETTWSTETDIVPNVVESQGRPLFTFSSETASLIKFLTVSTAPLSTDAGVADTGVTDGEITVERKDCDVCMQSLLDEGCSLVPDNAGRSANIDAGNAGAVKIMAGAGNQATEVVNVSVYQEAGNPANVVMETDVHGDIDKACGECGDCTSSDHDGSRLCAGCLDMLKVGAGVGPRACMGSGSSRGHKSCFDTAMYTDKNMKLNDSAGNVDIVNINSCLDEHVSVRLDEDDDYPATLRKNLIFVTGEFAVALHQLGFKSIPPSRESLLGRNFAEMIPDDMEAYNMVVNYSNNDIHIVQRQQEPDKPDHIIDLHGHVTGLCLTSDHRYLFINCRPWIGDIDRTDPWATPELSANIEVRIIDLLALQDVGVQYNGHKGFSPSNMCCFVFLDVSTDYVASGSEDSYGYLWDRHYRCLLARYRHDSGVVNAVAFSPTNQQYLVTASDDRTLKVWRSRAQVRRFNIPVIHDDQQHHEA